MGITEILSQMALVMLPSKPNSLKVIPLYKCTNRQKYKKEYFDGQKLRPFFKVKVIPSLDPFSPHLEDKQSSMSFFLLLPRNLGFDHRNKFLLN